MSYNLFLDDIRDPSQAVLHDYGVSLCTCSGIHHSEWVVVRSHDDFVHAIENNGLPNVVSFDHDLCFEHMRHYFDVTRDIGVIEYGNLKTPTGKASAEYLVKECRRQNAPLPTFFIHSANEIGRAEIGKVLRAWK